METENKNKVGKIIGIVFTVLLFTAIAAIFARIFLATHYPPSARGFRFTEPLLSYYRENGAPEVFSQELRSDYDNTREGYFFAGELLVAPDAGALQVSFRHNHSTREKVAALYETFDETAEQPFIYRAVCSMGEDASGEPVLAVAEPTEIFSSDWMMYHFDRLCFDGLDLSQIFWIRVEVYLPGEEEPLCFIPVYENTEIYHDLKPYRLTKEELP